MKILNKKLLALAVAGTLGMGSVSAMAEDGLSYNLAATNNYMWRGFTQTNNGAALQGGLDYASGKFSVGTWASNVVGGTEIDFYGSYALTDKASLGAIYYYYTFAGANTYEVNGSYSFGPVDVMLSYNPDLPSGSNNVYLEAGGSTEISKGWNLDWHVGNASGGTSIVDYLLGVSTSFSGLDASLAYANNNTAGAEGQVVATISKSF